MSLFLIAGVAASAVGQEAKQAGTQSEPITLALRVPRALPIVGTEQALVARLGGDLASAVEATVSFRWNSDEAQGQLGSHPIEWKPKATEAVVSQPWTPEKAGRYVLTARVQFPEGGQGSGPLEATQTVTAVKRSLHFHYYHINPSLDYVTGGVVKNETFTYWMDRGIVVQNWQPGVWGYNDGGIKTAEAFANAWVGPYRAGWPGIAIDEFYTSRKETREVDTLLCNALLKARELEPEMFIAAYTTGASADYKIRAFREAADLVLLETYKRNASRGFPEIRDRCDTAVQGGLEDKLLACLALGRSLSWKLQPAAAQCCITTPRELRRQLHFVRYRYPNMPGVAFFGNMEPLYPDLNETIRRFYIGPVLRVEVLDSGTVRIENIGADDAPAVKVRLREGEAAAERMIDVPPLDVGEHRLMPAPGNDLLPLTEYSGDCLILGPPLLWDREPAGHRPDATADWPAVGRAASEFRGGFDTEPKLDISHYTLGKTLRGRAFTKSYASARYALAATEGLACRLEFDLETAATGRDGSLTMEMSSKDEESRLGLTLHRGKDEPGAYFEVVITNPGGVMVTERIAQKIEPETNYRLRAEYHPEGFARVAVLDPAGERLWDTGEIPTYGKMTFDHMNFIVSDREQSTVTWDSERKALFMRDAAQDPGSVLSVYVDNLRVTSFKAARRR